MRQFRHKFSGELLSLPEDSKSIDVVKSSPSWEELKPDKPKKPEK